MLKKKITLLHYRIEQAGIDRVAYLLASGFAQAGFETELLLFCDGGSGETPMASLLHKDVKVSYLGQRRKNRTGDLIRLMPRCAKHIAQSKPDYMLSTCNHMNWITLTAAKLAKVDSKVIFKTTNPIIRKQDAGIYAKLRKFGYRKAFEKADLTLPLSHAETAMLAREFPTAASKMQTVTNPYVTPEMMVDRSSIETDGNSDIKTILCVGRFEYQKRMELLIQSFAHVADMNTRLVILGDGSERADCEKLVQNLGISDRVEMPGFVSNVTSWLEKADMFVLTSRYEGLPAVILEALAANCKILTTNSFPAAQELIEPLHACAIIQDIEPTKIAAQIDILLPQKAGDDLQKAASVYSIENGIADHIAKVTSL